MKLLRIKLPDSLHARLKVQAAYWGGTMQNMAVAALTEAVDTAEVSSGTGPKINPQPQPQKQEIRRDRNS